MSIIWRILDKDELPQAGDQAWNPDLRKWQDVTIPSMHMAGGKRIRGTRFRRKERREPPSEKGGADARKSGILHTRAEIDELGRKIIALIDRRDKARERLARLLTNG